MVSSIHALTIFCKVVDHFGDLGVCWRLSRQLAQERGIRTLIWVDDLKAIRQFHPHFIETATLQTIDSERTLGYWQDSINWQSIRQHPLFFIGNAVIEAFGCDLPLDYLRILNAQTPPPLWLNLEYLSAEPWVEDCHLCPSPQSGEFSRLNKYFFFPGFTHGTGGLIREATLKINPPDSLERTPTLTRLPSLIDAPISAHSADEVLISLFAYSLTAHAEAGQKLVHQWKHAQQPVHILCPDINAPKFAPILQALFPSDFNQSRQVGNLRWTMIPWLSQEDYDDLLANCDINIVRGEDSLVRAIWTGLPFCWHIYPQADDAHHPKLIAFLDRFYESVRSSPFFETRQWQVIVDFFRAWNGLPTAASIDKIWQNFLDDLPQIRLYYQHYAYTLSQQNDLASQLITFLDRLHPPRNIPYKLGISFT